MNTSVERRWVTLVPGQVHIMFGIEKIKRQDLIQSTKEYDQQCLAFLDESDAPLVHLIDDLRGIRNVPPISSIYNMQFLRHPRLGCYVTLGVLSNPVLRFVATRVSSLIRLRYKDATSLDDAYAFLFEKDPTLPSRETWTIPLDIQDS